MFSPKYNVESIGYRSLTHVVPYVFGIIANPYEISRSATEI